MIWIRFCLLIPVVLGFALGLSADVLYSVADLGTLSGRRVSIGGGINNAGQVTGSSYASPSLDGEAHAFLYSNGEMADLGTLGGVSSFGYGINDSGQVTGSSSTTSGAVRAFLYSNGQMQNLGTLGGSFSQGSAINNLGQVTGSSSPADTSRGTKAFIYSAGQMSDLGAALVPEGQGRGINNLGQVTGWYGEDPIFVTNN